LLVVVLLVKGAQDSMLVAVVDLVVSVQML
jgi:hypothetical protein